MTAQHIANLLPFIAFAMLCVVAGICKVSSVQRGE